MTAPRAFSKPSARAVLASFNLVGVGLVHDPAPTMRKKHTMQTKTYTVMVGAVIAGLFAVSLAVVSARQAIAIDPDDIGGVVSGPK